MSANAASDEPVPVTEGWGSQGAGAQAHEADLDGEASPELRLWRQYLAGRSPRAVLTRIVPGDPLRVRALVAEAIRDRCLLLDGEDVVLRAYSVIAAAAPEYRGRPRIERWLAARIDEALCARSTQGESPTRESPEPGRRRPGAWSVLAEPLGLDARGARAAAAAFDELEPQSRHAFFALALRKTPLEEYAAAVGASPGELARAARRAWLTIIAAYERTVSAAVAGSGS